LQEATSEEEKCKSGGEEGGGKRKPDPQNHDTSMADRLKLLPKKKRGKGSEKKGGRVRVWTATVPYGLAT